MSVTKAVGGLRNELNAGPRQAAWIWIAGISIAVRAALLLVWTGGHPEFYRLGGEIGRVALSLISAGTFADPYMIATGATAHPAPLSPALLALIYNWLGVTAQAGYLKALLGIASYSTLYALMPWFGRQLGLGHRAGVIAGLFCALIPMEGLGEVLGVGGTAHAALAFALVVVAFAHRWEAERAGTAASLGLGLACGAAFHLLPPLVLVALGYLAFEVWWKRSRLALWRVLCVVLGATLACVPWTLRNYRELGDWIFIRSNFGLELRIANHPGAAADIEVTWERQGTVRHPSENLSEAQLVRTLGEAEYNRRARREATEWIQSHPWEFLRLTGLRLLNFWCGPLRWPLLATLHGALTGMALLGLRGVARTASLAQQAVLVVPLIAFPLVYYLVSYVGHYPAPLAWLLTLLAGYQAAHWHSGAID